MPKKWRTKLVILIGIIISLALLFYLYSHCFSYKPTHLFIVDSSVKHAVDYNSRLVDSAVTLLKSGYIVLRMGQGADSYLLAQLNQKDKTFSHCGIVFIEHEYPFVYHSIGGEDNPDERLRRDSAKFFFSPAHNLALAVVNFNFDMPHTQKLQETVYEYYKKQPKFDLKFDLKTDDYLYCAEFVYKAINKAMEDTGYIKTTTLMGCTFVGIDNLFINNHAKIIWQTKFK